MHLFKRNLLRKDEFGIAQSKGPLQGDVAFANWPDRIAACFLTVSASKLISSVGSVAPQLALGAAGWALAPYWTRAFRFVKPIGGIVNQALAFGLFGVG
jgi:hypothetical protein